MTDYLFYRGSLAVQVAAARIFTNQVPYVTRRCRLEEHVILPYNGFSGEFHQIRAFSVTLFAFAMVVDVET